MSSFEIMLCLVLVLAAYGVAARWDDEAARAARAESRCTASAAAPFPGAGPARRRCADLPARETSGQGGEP